MTIITVLVCLIVARQVGRALNAVATRTEVLKLQALAGRVFVEDSVLDYILKIVTATRTETPRFDVPASIDVVDGDTLRAGADIFHNLKSILKKEGMVTAVGEVRARQHIEKVTREGLVFDGVGPVADANVRKLGHVRAAAVAARDEGSFAGV